MEDSDDDGGEIDTKANKNKVNLGKRTKRIDDINISDNKSEQSLSNKSVKHEDIPMIDEKGSNSK